MHLKGSLNPVGEEVQLHTVTNEPTFRGLPRSHAFCDFSFILATTLSHILLLLT